MTTHNNTGRFSIRLGMCAYHKTQHNNYSGRHIVHGDGEEALYLVNVLCRHWEAVSDPHEMP